jgi:hypothetical protein
MISETKYMPGYKNKKLKDDLCSSIVTYETDCKLIKIFKQKATHTKISQKNYGLRSTRKIHWKDSHRYQNWFNGNFKGPYFYLFWAAYFVHFSALSFSTLIYFCNSCYPQTWQIWVFQTTPPVPRNFYCYSFIVHFCLKIENSTLWELVFKVLTVKVFLYPWICWENILNFIDSQLICICVMNMHLYNGLTFV